MTTFVLIYGSWHGGWCWRKVVPLLQSRGHRVYTPTLTSLGERSHLLSPEVDLDTHIRHVCQVLEYEDLGGVTLVGHSYAGMVISGVAEQIPERMAALFISMRSFPRTGNAGLTLCPVRDKGPKKPLETGGRAGSCHHPNRRFSAWKIRWMFPG